MESSVEVEEEVEEEVEVEVVEEVEEEVVMVQDVEVMKPRMRL